MTPLEWGYLIFTLAVTIYGLTRPAPKVPDATVQTGEGPTAQEGRPIPVLFGTFLIRDSNIVWYGNTYTVPIKTKSGKK